MKLIWKRDPVDGLNCNDKIMVYIDILFVYLVLSVDVHAVFKKNMRTVSIINTIFFLWNILRAPLEIKKKCYEISK